MTPSLKWALEHPYIQKSDLRNETKLVNNTSNNVRILFVNTMNGKQVLKSIVWKLSKFLYVETFNFDP
jgi:hypothetical protein